MLPYNDQPQNDFYPRPPRGGRHRHLAVPVLGEIISIHALREEGDLFNLQLSELIQVISIHALREEGDRWCYYTTNRAKNFYPRPPRGGRRKIFW